MQDDTFSVDSDGAGSPADESLPSTITRRAAIQRAAIAGGALTFAVPVVQRLGGTALAGATTSPVPPPPPPPPPPPTCRDISNLQIIVSKVGTGGNTKYYGLKYDPDDADPWNDWSSAAPDSNDCIRYWEDDTGKTVLARDTVADAFNSYVEVDQISDCEWRVRLPLPNGYTFEAGYVKTGNVSNLPDGCPPSATPTATYIPFYGPPA